MSGWWSKESWQYLFFILIGPNILIRICFFFERKTHSKIYISLHSRWLDILHKIVLPHRWLFRAGATISIKKFLPRHRRRRQATSPFIAEGDPSFLRIRSCGTLLLSKEVHANDPAACDSSSLSKLPVIPDAEVFHHFSLISRYALVTRSFYLFVCPR